MEYVVKLLLDSIKQNDESDAESHKSFVIKTVPSSQPVQQQQSSGCCGGGGQQQQQQPALQVGPNLGDQAQAGAVGDS